jgi:uncharacterized protein YcgL (UPF0745 family)
MLCAIYKTRKKQGMYLYVPKKDHFDDVPDVLKEMFGKPELVTILALDKHKALANVDKQKLIDALTNEGFYLQMPPKEDDLLMQHRASLGLPTTADKK